MPTPFLVTGFEHQVVSPNGAGLFNSVNGNITIDNTFSNSGQSSLKIAPTGAASSNVRRNLPAGSQVLVLSGYIALNAGNFPSNNTAFFGCLSATGSIFSGINLTSAGVIRCQTGSGGTLVTSSVTMTADQFYRIDMVVSQAGTTWTVDWAIDGVVQTQVSAGSQTQGDISVLRFGTSTTAITLIGWVDDVVASVVSGDYPIGPHATEYIKPSSDGTHNAGTNTMENQAGTDIGTAWSLLDDLPMSTATEYLKQSTIGTGNYVEVVFNDLVSDNSGIIGAMAILAYTSQTTSANSGGTIVSKDSFSSQVAVHGAPGSLADYSDGSTSDVYYKSVMITDVDTLTEVNALKARMGYSGDVTGNPYWVNIGVEVAYVPGAPPTTIDLDLVSYSVTVNSINITEHEIIPLDLVTFSSSINDVTILENEPILLDLVTYPSTINDIVIVENEVIPLDLVSFSSSIQDVTIIEQEIIVLDLVSYSASLNDIVILENEIIILDLVSYTVVINEVIVLENEVIQLDLVSYSNSINDLIITEQEVVSLDLVTYTNTYPEVELLEEGGLSLELVAYVNTFNDLVITEHEVISLDLVSYTTSVNDVELTEQAITDLDLVAYVSVINDITIIESEIISLDLVNYSLITNDLVALEHEITPLDLVVFSSSINSIELIEDSILALDLVTYSYVVNPTLVISSGEIVITPLSRTYVIEEEKRQILIGSENRTYPIEHEERSILIQ